MLQEDRLSQDQRLRLEALAQAIVASGAHAGRQQHANDIVRRARTFEEYIRTGTVGAN